MSNKNSPVNEPLDNPVYLLKSHCHYLLNTVKENLIGKILTVIDSAIQDERQNKATKDLIKQAIWNSDIHVNEYEDLISQFTRKHCKELIPFLKDVETDPHPCRTYFK